MDDEDRKPQPYHLVIFGEKSSLDPILSGIAYQFQADLYLPTGEISDVMMYQMAKSGSADPRKMIVFCVSDCDPSGWQMPISIGRKLQAFKVSKFDNRLRSAACGIDALAGEKGFTTLA